METKENKLNLSEDWLSFFSKHNLTESITTTISKVYSSIDVILPPQNKVLNAFSKTDYKNISCIIIAQDPYVNLSEAIGLSFAVEHGIKFPPSLLNIYKNLLKFNHIKEIPKNCDIQEWTKYGVLMLNSSLTTIHKKMNAHQKYWSKITDKIIEEISNEKKELVFILLGNFAINKEKLINKKNKHKIIKATHPSPLSCYKSLNPNIPAFIDADVFKELYDKINGKEEKDI